MTGETSPRKSSRPRLGKSSCVLLARSGAGGGTIGMGTNDETGWLVCPPRVVYISGATVACYLPTLGQVAQQQSSRAAETAAAHGIKDGPRAGMGHHLPLSETSPSLGALGRQVMLLCLPWSRPWSESSSDTMQAFAGG